LREINATTGNMCPTIAAVRNNRNEGRNRVPEFTETKNNLRRCNQNIGEIGEVDFVHAL